MLIFMVFFLAPCMYFKTSHRVYGAKKNKLFEKYQEEALCLRGVVQKRWTTTSHGEGPPTPTIKHHIQVIYNIQEERYIKDFDVVSPTEYLETEADLMVLPMYPRSAILVKETHVEDPSDNWLLFYFSVIWGWGCNIMLVYSLLNDSIVKDKWLVWPIVACEVAVTWIAGYFIICAFANYELRSILFGANIVDSSNNIIPQEQIPKVTYQEMFPSS